MKRLLPLGILLISVSARAATAGRCPGMAKLTESLNKGAMALPAKPWDGTFPGKDACHQAVWNYIAKYGPKHDAFNRLSGRAQLVVIQELAGQLEELDKRVAAINEKVAAYRKDVETFRDPKTPATKQVDLLSKIIHTEGQPDSLNPSNVGPKTVRGGTDLQEIRQAFIHLASHELLRKHGAPRDESKFGPGELKQLWSPNPSSAANQPRWLGAFSFVDWDLGQAVEKAYVDSLQIVNGVNKAVIDSESKTVANLRAALMYKGMQEMTRNGGSQQPAKPEVETAVRTVTADQEAFRKAFAEKSATEIFDGLNRRTALPAEHPDHITKDQAERLRAQYAGAEAEIVDKKVILTVKDKTGKKHAVPGAEAALPEQLTADKGRELAQKVAGDVLASDDFKARVRAVIGAVTGSQPTPQTPNLTADLKLPDVKPGEPVANAPQGFAADAAGANCGSPMDIGKSKPQLALEAKLKAISEKAGENSKSRAKVYKDFEAGVEKADKDHEERVRAIEARYRAAESNPLYDAGRLKAFRQELDKEIESSLNARNESVKALEAKRNESIVALGVKSEKEKEFEALREAEYKRAREGYDQQINARVDALRAEYKPGSERVVALASALTRARVGGSSEERPFRASNLNKELLDEYFNARWGADRAKTAQAFRRRMGVPDQGKLDPSDLADFDDVERILQSDMVSFYAEKAANARRSRAPSKGDREKPADQTVVQPEQPATKPVKYVPGKSPDEQ